MRAGDNFIIRMGNGENDCLAVRCEVVFCNAMQGQFCSIGAKFVGQPYRETLPGAPAGKILGPEPTSTNLSRLRKAIRG